MKALAVKYPIVFILLNGRNMTATLNMLVKHSLTVNILAPGKRGKSI
jgi:hypothetical protein